MAFAHRYLTWRIILDGNLYVGTSASELLHFVRIPTDPGENNGQPMFILASRLKPAYSESSATSSASLPGIQQILLLPRVSRGCILCNGTVTFYSLPELSPVLQVKNCNWIGGVDLNDETRPDGSSVTVLLSTYKRIQVVRVGEEARVIRVGPSKKPSHLSDVG